MNQVMNKSKFLIITSALVFVLCMPMYAWALEEVALMPTLNWQGYKGHLNIIDVNAGIITHKIDFNDFDHPIPDSDVIVTPDGTTALMPSFDYVGLTGHLRIIDINSGTVNHKIDFGDFDRPIAGVDVVLTPDGMTALMPTFDYVGYTGHLRIIDVNSGAVTHKIDFNDLDHPVGDVDVVVTPDGMTALMPTFDYLGYTGHLRIIDINSGVVRHKIDFGDFDRPLPGLDVVVTPDGMTALMPTFDYIGYTGHLRIIDINTGVVNHKIDFNDFEHPCEDVDVVVTPDGMTALMPTSDYTTYTGHLRIIDIPTGVVNHKIDFSLYDHPIVAVDVVVTPDGTTALIPTYDESGFNGHLKIIDINSGTVTSEVNFPFYDHPIREVDVVVTPDSMTALMPTYDYSGYNGHLKIIDIGTGTVNHEIDFAIYDHPITGVDVVITADGSRALMPTFDFTYYNGHLRIIDINSGTVTGQIDFPILDHPHYDVDVVLTSDPNIVLMPTNDYYYSSSHLRIIDINSATVNHKIDFNNFEHLVWGVDAVACSEAGPSYPVSLDEDFYGWREPIEECNEPNEPNEPPDDGDGNGDDDGGEEEDDEHTLQPGESVEIKVANYYVPEHKKLVIISFTGAGADENISVTDAWGVDDSGNEVDTAQVAEGRDPELGTVVYTFTFDPQPAFEVFEVTNTGDAACSFEVQVISVCFNVNDFDAAVELGEPNTMVVDNMFFYYEGSRATVEIDQIAIMHEYKSADSCSPPVFIPPEPNDPCLPSSRYIPNSPTGSWNIEYIEEHPSVRDPLGKIIEIPQGGWLISCKRYERGIWETETFSLSMTTTEMAGGKYILLVHDRLRDEWFDFSFIADGDYQLTDNFEAYASGSELRSTWNELGNAQVGLSRNTEHVLGGEQSMRYNYDNSLPPYYSEVKADTYDLQIGSDWTVEGVVELTLFVQGKGDNDVGERMYVTVKDKDYNSKTVRYDGDPNVLSDANWFEWNIPLMEFSDSSVDLENVQSIAIGFGDGNYPAGSGSGQVWFDNIRRTLPERCKADFDCSGTVNLSDLGVFGLLWLARIGDDQWEDALSEAIVDTYPQPYGDGIINFRDFSVLAEEWLEECEYKKPHEPECPCDQHNFDLTSDGKVGLGDLNLLILCVATNPDECPPGTDYNCDEKTDQSDIDFFMGIITNCFGPPFYEGTPEQAIECCEQLQ